MIIYFYIRIWIISNDLMSLQRDYLKNSLLSNKMWRFVNMILFFFLNNDWSTILSGVNHHSAHTHTALKMKLDMKIGKRQGKNKKTE